MAKVRFEFDPMKATGVKVPKKNRAEALADVADYVKEQILARTADGRTSVKGGKWKRSLTPEYKKRKREESGVGYANMELSGDMLDALESYVEGNRVRVEISGEEAGKAEGNLLGSYGGDPDPSKAREFMPHARGQQLSPEIMQGVRAILRRHEED